MKQTAIDWLIGRFHYEGFIGTYCYEEQIKSKRELMIEIIKQAKEMEKQQMFNALIKGADIHGAYDIELEFKEYYNETFKNK